MDIDRLREELAIDEGVKHEVYLCSLGHKTHGIGHLITKDDEEWDYEVGDAVSPERVASCFAKDVQVCINDCEIIFDGFNSYPEEAQRVFANMSFQLGRPTLSKFRKAIAFAEDGDWQSCSEEILRSRWAKQTPNRAERLSNRLAALAVPA